jgi:holo-[acyl-carrier protein] synthase
VSVIGIGTDIIDITRLEKMKQPVLERLAMRVLTKDEYARFDGLKYPHAFLAKRWAGKEAAAKALGTGIADGVSFQNFVIQSLETGQPILQLSGRALEIAQNLGANHWHISLSDEKIYATAFVVLSK